MNGVISISPPGRTADKRIPVIGFYSRFKIDKIYLILIFNRSVDKGGR